METSIEFLRPSCFQFEVIMTTMGRIVLRDCGISWVSLENTQKRCTNKKEVNTHKIEIGEYFLCVNNIFMNNKVISRLQVKSLLSK